MLKYTLKGLLPEDAIILDAGAFNGNDSIDFANIFPKGHVYAFEPVKEIYETLVNNTKDYKNITALNLALSDKFGMENMYISSGMSVQSSSLLKPKEHLEKFPACVFENEEIVQTTTINQFCKDLQIDRIDFMWLDLQGSEHAVLQNADLILPTTKGIFTEYSLVEYYDGLTLYDEFKKFMIEIGFEESMNETIYNELGMGNSLFVRKK